MNLEQLNNNKAIIQGRVASQPQLTHESYGEGFFEVMVEVSRLSNNVDFVPVTISRSLLSANGFEMGQNVIIKGQLRSHNKMINGKSKLILSVFAREIVKELNENEIPNQIEISGFVCKPSIFRVTPFKREICDLLVAVNRAFNKSDYLPCIAWGKNARIAHDIKVGSKIEIKGRIQSREYQKRDENGKITTKTAFEVSVSHVKEGISSLTVEKEEKIQEMV